MTLELLNSDTHATVRMHPGDAMSEPLVRIVISEIVTAAAACPVFFSKHAESGAFYVGALTGFRRGEPLIDSPDGRWAFRPFEIDRQGFFASGDSIVLDPDHPRFAVGGSEALFHPDRTPTAALRAVQKAIGGLMAGAAATDAFIAAMLAHRLIEPVDISLSFDDGDTLRLDGLYTVSLDALSELPDSVVVDLFRSGHLQPAFALAGSLHHVGLMARRRNARLAQIG